MNVDVGKTIEWFRARKGKLTYSMYGSRNGSDGTADCSGSVTQAVYEAGASKPNYLYSTVTIKPWLESNSYKVIAENAPWNAKAGDIPIFFPKRLGLSGSAGSAGHIGIISTDDPSCKFISTDFSTGGQHGTAVSEHLFDPYYENCCRNGLDGFVVMRYVGNQPTPQEPSVKNVVISKHATHWSPSSGAKPIDKVLIGKNVEVMKEQVKVYSWSKKEYLVKLNGKELGWLLEQDTWGQLPSKIPVTKDKRKVYRIDDLQFVNGVWQVRCNDLAPAGFDWTDNGIPVDYITKINADGTNLASNGTEVKKGDCFVFDYGQLSDTNYGVYDSGWYWRQFGTARHGRIWLSAWNGNHLYYG